MWITKSLTCSGTLHVAEDPHFFTLELMLWALWPPLSIAAKPSGHVIRSRRGPPPTSWRRLEYMQTKWFSPHQRTTTMDEAKEESVSGGAKSSYGSGIVPRSILAVNFSSEFKDFGITEAAGNGSGGRQR
ncbi:hypothetical protein Cni_G28718 [Canna indica]|uniref:Uncharacterized protein n=1 Tax=Canna indica TaxID=4628 RepID=A0AAQ3L7U6_9LILI|nr:hypothetical protein Cni_G28718 [Canna indica]